jgi:N-acetyl-alpha-D-glucosaminyl L-malate synthase BshA
VIPNFVDTDHFAPPPRRDRAHFAPLLGAGDGPVLFHVSNFRAVKRTADLMHVLAQLRREVPARLVLVGDGPERAQTAELAGALGLRDSVCFLGRRTDFAAELAHADAFVLPSESESFGVAALEALSAGVPVFAYRVGGLPEVVAEGTGRLVEPFDVAALAQAVLAAVTDPAAHAALSAAARTRAITHFRRDTALDRYEACYRQVLEDAK